ncbi:uncharacterized protein LOC133849095 isoform X1 [Drosophila sulfurigaster albostrigata]|uniref:uncharacterized protein LOC133849095 isoform X1 n=1 Tax=Drosophila sulfurigaster albostrigata TaxID=89887 RepID=UPI002D21EA75|nr:uncharacterized protein LOC133849095 isoform X1 [Drosophila sulfurigaster albostrigata]
MLMHKLSRIIKPLAWILISATCIKLLLSISLPDDRGPISKRYVRTMSADSAHRKSAQDDITYTTPNEPLLLQQLLAANAPNNWCLNPHCAPYPRAEDLHIEQQYYQYTLGRNVSYYLYAAYYDRRPAIINTPSITILAMMSSMTGPFAHAYCQVWYEADAEPHIVLMQRLTVVWHKEWSTEDGQLYPVLLSCQLPSNPRSSRVPELVSLVFDDRCARPTNALRVVYEAPQRKRVRRFAVCVKDLNFPHVEMSQRWIEWLEMLRLLGAERVTAYDLGGESLLPQTRRTLQHYVTRDGLVRLRPHRLLHKMPTPTLNWLSKSLNEVLCYVDCFYRHIYEFDYVGIFDVDEVIMPLGELHNWTALLQQLERDSNQVLEENCEARASYCFRNIYFPNDWPVDERVSSAFHMLQHVQRVPEHSDHNSYVKCLHSTHFVQSVHNHFPFSWHGSCGPYDVPVELGQLQHYRKFENRTMDRISDRTSVRDDNIWRFKDKLMLHVLAKQRELDRS